MKSKECAVNHAKPAGVAPGDGPLTYYIEKREQQGAEKKKRKKWKKGIDKRGRIWYSNKAVRHGRRRAKKK